MGGRRLARVLGAALALALSAPTSAGAAPEDDLADAQRRANAAARQLSDAETALAEAEDAVAHLQGRVATIDTRVGATRQQVSQLAIWLYVGGTSPIVRILRMADANDVIRAQQYSHVIAGGSTDALHQFRADREDLTREQARLEEEQEAHAESLENLRARRDDAIAEIDRLSEVVAEAAAAREAQRRATEAAEAAAVADRARTASPSAPAPLTAAPAPAGTSGPTAASSTVPPTTVPDPPEVEVDADADWICPVQGPLAFSDDYGAPRGGGYTHQGNDILSPRGTPVVASVDGVVRHRSGAISGLAYYLDGDDGNEYFGAHLDSFGESGRVTAGTIVGRVGNTGDAASTAPHLHFEIHPGGSGYENPYPTLVKYC